MTYPVLSASSSTGYQIQRSVRTRSSANGYFNRTPATASNRRTFTWSSWVKRGALGVALDILGIRIDGNNQFRFFFNASDQIDVYNQVSATIGARLITTAVYRDPSAWYHVVLAIDTTNATAGDRMRLYVNGVEVTAFGTDTQPSLNYDTYINTVNAHNIGSFPTGGYFDGYLAEINFVNGLALTPTSFGEFNSITGVWQPKGYSGAYSTNGFYLKFTDNSASTATTIGKDFSGNNNNWTPNNISVTAGVTYDSMLDVPTLNNSTAGNFATLNPIDRSTASAPTAGNLQYTYASNAYYNGVRATIGISSGKWYWETTCTAIGSGGVYAYTGIALNTFNYDGSTNVAINALGTYYYMGNGNKSTGTGAGQTVVAYGATYTANDVIGVALDMDAGTLTFYKNGATQGTAYTGLSGTFFPAIVVLLNVAFAVNFGQRPFAYTPPTGFKRLCTTNLSSPAIPNGATNFAATQYTGTGASLSVVNTVNSVSFQPDWVWIKGVSGATAPAAYDSVRGVTNQLIPNATSVESIQATGLTAFNASGFTVGALAALNTSAATYVAWNWKAGSSTVTNTAGSITSSVRANPSAGFSIVTYTGTGANATVGHGLGIAPRMLIIKRRNSATNWPVYHASIGGAPDNFVYLNSTSAVINAGIVFNGTTPNSTIFGVGTDAIVNASGGTYVAYCFAQIAGFSSFGNYEGNNNANGPFIYTGFRPRLVVVKEYTSARGWIMMDTSRSPVNVVDKFIFGESNQTQQTQSFIDILSNGFKIRSTNINVNDVVGQRFLYYAFAENPFNYSLAR